MHSLQFGTKEMDARALDGLLRAVDRGDVETIRLKDGRFVVTLSVEAAKRVPPRRLLTAR